MTRRQWILLGALAVGAALVTALALRTKKPPFLPSDAEHATFVSGEACLSCHGRGGVSPQSRGHPLGFECLRCHASR